jgi:hypothetical protein
VQFPRRFRCQRARYQHECAVTGNVQNIFAIKQRMPPLPDPLASAFPIINNNPRRNRRWACRKVFLRTICKGIALCLICIDVTAGRNVVV